MLHFLCVCVLVLGRITNVDEGAVPTMRHGVQSSNCALSFLRASWKVGGEGGCRAILTTIERYAEMEPSH
jgi:hypothetical protein